MDAPTADSTAGDDPRRRRWQFSLGTLLVATSGLAVGLSVLWAEGADWGTVPLVAAATWIVMGLLWQARDLFVWRRDAVLSTDERFGWRFAVAWRVAIAALLVLYYLIIQSPERGCRLLPESDDALFSTGKELREAVFYLALIVVLGSVGLPRPARRPSRFSRVVGTLGGAAAASLAAWVFREQLCVPVLVFIAIFGIEASSPLKYAHEAVGQNFALQMRMFFWAAWAAVGLAGLGGVFILAMARQWHRRLWRSLWAVCLTACLVPAAAFAIWTYGWQLRRLSPSFASALGWPKPHQWVTAAILGAMLVTALAWRWCQQGPVATGPVPWRRHPRYYYHERVAVLAVLCVAAIAPFANIVVAFWAHGRMTFQPWISPTNFLTLLAEFFSFHQGYLYLALLVSAATAFARSCRRSDRSGWNTPGRLAPGRFWAVWIALWGLLLVAVPAITWAAFGSWFTPWM